MAVPFVPDPSFPLFFLIVGFLILEIHPADAKPVKVASL